MQVPVDEIKRIITSSSAKTTGTIAESVKYHVRHKSHRRQKESNVWCVFLYTLAHAQH